MLGRRPAFLGVPPALRGPPRAVHLVVPPVVALEAHGKPTPAPGRARVAAAPRGGRAGEVPMGAASSPGPRSARRRRRPRRRARRRHRHQRVGARRVAQPRSTPCLVALCERRQLPVQRAEQRRGRRQCRQSRRGAAQRRLHREQRGAISTACCSEWLIAQTIIGRPSCAQRVSASSNSSGAARRASPRTAARPGARCVGPRAAGSRPVRRRAGAWPPAAGARRRGGGPGRRARRGRGGVGEGIDPFASAELVAACESRSRQRLMGISEGFQLLLVVMFSPEFFACKPPAVVV